MEGLQANIQTAKPKSLNLPHPKPRVSELRSTGLANENKALGHMILNHTQVLREHLRCFFRLLHSNPPIDLLVDLVSIITLLLVLRAKP